MCRLTSRWRALRELPDLPLWKNDLMLRTIADFSLCMSTFAGYSPRMTNARLRPPLPQIR